MKSDDLWSLVIAAGVVIALGIALTGRKGTVTVGALTKPEAGPVNWMDVEGAYPVGVGR